MTQMCGELCAGELCAGELCAGELCDGAVFHTYLASLVGFIHGSVQYVTLCHVPVDVLPRLFL